MKLEVTFEREFCSKLKTQFPNQLKVLKVTTSQGWPDRAIFANGRTAFLEFKRYDGARHQPNQGFYVNFINQQGGFARFINPENQNEVYLELLHYLELE